MKKAYMIRFIIDSEHDPVFNMAADLYLLSRCTAENRIFVRFYGWNVPSITVGYMQKATEVLDIEAIKRENVSWIKRPTGGRAVLHFQDLTYSCIFPRKMRYMGSTVQESYNVITTCLMEGLKEAGIDCQSHDSYDQLLEVRREVKLPCFLAPNRDEIMVNGKKLVGSAQRRTTMGVLQHGSIPLTGYFRKLPLYLNISERERLVQMRLLLQKSVCTAEINPELKSSILIESLKNGFIKKIPFPWVEESWSVDEIRSIRNFKITEEQIQ